MKIGLLLRFLDGDVITSGIFQNLHARGACLSTLTAPFNLWICSYPFNAIEPW